MSTDHKTLNRLIAGLVFIYAFIIYLSTLSPTASFWDPGEFIAVAHGLEVTHPPGSPLFLLLGRLFSMFMPASKVAYSINLISGLASALTIMLLYLIIIRLVVEWKGKPDTYRLVDKIGLYAGGVIGALTFAVTDSFWFNAVEAEVYATSMLFTAMVVWLVLKWAEHHEEPNNERWLVLIAYMFGLAVGVHLLNLLAIFFVVLIIYFKKYDFKITTFLVAALIASGSFLVIYPITVADIPSWAGDLQSATLGLIKPSYFLIVFLALIIWAVYYTHKKKMRIANIAFLCYAMIFIGFSSYALVLIRSQQDPPIDENDPETVHAFVSYINRDQYGQTPLFMGHDYNNSTGRIDRTKKVLFPRRYSSDSNHLQKYAQYNSDWDYFWDYQVGHMYLRYFAWQFIGRQSDIQDTGVATGFSSSSRYKDNPAHNVYYFLPFLLGIIGMVFHFQKDWKRALSVLALFIMTGFAIIIFLNQYPFQPRERDYAYVGSFFAFSIWIGLGATGLIELAKDMLKENKWVAYGLAGIMFLAVPLNMLRQNYHDHDRSNRYVAPDYAYNLLNSTAPYAILFTNGDNDTFPLWYLQEVEHVRTDVRVVCLSLLNTKWYIKQLKNQWSHESPPLPISLTNNQIDHLDDKFQFNDPSDFYTPHDITIPVDKNYLENRFEDSNNTEQYALQGHFGISKDTSYVLRTSKMKYSIPVDSLDSTVTWHYQGNFLGQDQNGNKLYYTRIQDDLILNILKTNRWARPVYFAVTVAHAGQLNLQSYFRLEGQAYRVVPKKNSSHSPYIDTKIHAKRLRSFRFRGINDPKTYLDENIRRMVDNYRELISSEAMTFQSENKSDSARYWLKWGEQHVPFSTVKGDPSSQIRYAFKYARVGDTTDAVRLGQATYHDLKEDLQYYMNQLNRLENRISDLKTQSRQARMNADVDKSRKYDTAANNLAKNREDYIRNVYFAASRLFVLQRIYYMAGDQAKAKEIAQVGDQITQNRIGFPKTKEE
ncbi:MAG TPA: DUF2723 domain-containing protein, partial [Balneolales bacterium]|nr:DUF2723 domain-containing protein [Balneolales bacterium]